jgi:UDP-N-acetylglucosamine--N-acetylmuramyl-(pentapeptide) pyrophosphoryl-undecaprenol N-acetylglucosamine transferase
MQKRLSILISGGGTGGHIFPALAIAEAIRRREPSADFLFVGARGKMEMEKVPAAGYPIKGLWISGLQRKLSFRNLLFPLKVISSLIAARSILRRFRPDIAIGVGGYASAPALWVASGRGIPILIQEQNAFPGIANRILSKRADAICVAYEGMQRYFPDDRLHLTGNPVRHSVLPSREKKDDAAAFFGLDPHRPILLVTGGSLGALTLNRVMEKDLEKLLQSGIQIIWQCGQSYAARAEKLNEIYAGKGVYITPFIHRMDLAYSLANLIVSRAGAMAIAELAAAGKACILVPSPNVTEDHQRKNALALVGKEAALMVEDADAPELLGNKILSTLHKESSLRELEKNISRDAIRDADDKIAAIALEMITKRKAEKK